MQTYLIAAFVAAPLALIAPAHAQTMPPDVSQLEYRVATLMPIQKWPFPNSATEQTARLWIVPARDGQTARGIGWNGVPLAAAPNSSGCFGALRARAVG